MPKTVFQILHPLSCQYEGIHGFPPFDISTWNPSQEFIDRMKPVFQYTPFDDLVNYHYTHLLPSEKKALFTTLGFDFQQKDCIISSNGTSSLSLFSNWINHQQFKELQIVIPNYFSPVENCKLHGIEAKFLQIEDLNDIDRYHNQVFLFTNPCYSLGKSISKKHIDTIGKLLDRNWVVVDECLANKGDELSLIYGTHPHFMGIYTPHKSVCLNGLKFSLIVFPIEFQLFFAQSVDYLTGAISSSSLSGVKHYLSDNFDLYRIKFQEYIYSTHLFVEELLSEYPTAIYEGEGHYYFATIFFPNIRASLSTNENWLWSIIERSGTIFTPGYYNNYPENLGFCFRINLAQDSPLFRKSLRRLLDTLARYEEQTLDANG